MSSSPSKQKKEGMFCVPSIGANNGSSCFDRAGLLHIIKKYNNKYDHKIAYNVRMTNRELWNSIRDGMAQTCGDQEWCWLDQDFLKHDSTVKKYYKPPKPKTPTKWLATSDIDGVLKQYEEIYPDFFFMGTVPIDFDEVIDDYKNIDLCRMYQGGGAITKGHPIRRYGFVFNLDPHDQRGSHWVCMFMNLAGHDQFIGFFDSYGQPPPAQIKQLIAKLKSQAKSCLGVDLKYKCNTVRHQQKNTECGVYCLYFIYQCLRGLSFETITENIILDNDVNQFRHFFFRPTIDYQP
jgi:hypothetical protein